MDFSSQPPQTICGFAEAHMQKTNPVLLTVMGQLVEHLSILLWFRRLEPSRNPGIYNYLITWNTPLNQMKQQDLLTASGWVRWEWWPNLNPCCPNITFSMQNWRWLGSLRLHIVPVPRWLGICRARPTCCCFPSSWLMSPQRWTPASGTFLDGSNGAMPKNARELLLQLRATTR